VCCAVAGMCVREKEKKKKEQWYADGLERQQQSFYSSLLSYSLL
jgi:hypothetical protein